MKKRILATLLSMVLVLSLLSGCGDKGEITTQAPNTEDAGKTEAPETNAPGTDAPTTEETPAEPVDLVWLSHYGSNVPVEKDSYVEKLLEEKCNVNITPITDVTQENMPMYIASEGILNATVFTTYLVGNSLSTLTDMYDQELIREIPEEYLWEYYPTGMQRYVDFLGQDYFDEGKHLIEGKLLNIPFTGFGKSAKHGWLYRLDWAQKLGIEEPTSLEEFHDMLYKFTFNDPDGNNVNDTYGMGGCTNFNTQLTPFFGSFGFYSYKFYEDLGDGNVIYWGAQEKYRQALTVLKEWYDEGIIDPEMVTDNRDLLRAKWAAGRIGAIADTQTFITRQKSTGVVQMMIDAYGSKDIVGVIGQMTSPYGDGYVYMADKIYTTYTNSGLVFTASATDEQIIAVLKIQEAIASDPDLYMAINYGELGVDYEIKDNTINYLVDMSVEYQASKGLAQYYDCATMPIELEGKFGKDEYWDAIKTKVESTQSGGITQNSNVTVVSEVADQYKSEINKVAAEYFTNVLLGKTTLSDADWNAYLDKLNAAGLDKVIADYERLIYDK